MRSCIFLLVLCGFPLLASGQQIVPEKVEQAAANTVQVEFPMTEHATSRCSGVYLGSRYVATTAFASEGSSGRGFVNFRDGTSIPCEVIMVDAVWQQSIVELEKEHPSLPGVELASCGPRAGDQVYSSGIVQGHRIFSGKVNVERFKPAGESRDNWFKHSSAAVAGEGGGPVFTADGQLIGCHWGAGENYTVATDNEMFREFIRPILPKCGELIKASQ